MGAGARLAEERDRWPDHWRVADLEQEEEHLLDVLDPAEELLAAVPGAPDVGHRRPGPGADRRHRSPGARHRTSAGRRLDVDARRGRRHEVRGDDQPGRRHAVPRRTARARPRRGRAGAGCGTRSTASPRGSSSADRSWGRRAPHRPRLRGSSRGDGVERAARPRRGAAGAAEWRTQLRRLRSNVVTAPPSALPRVAFITAPTSAPIALSSPPTNFAHAAGLAAMASSTSDSSARVVHRLEALAPRRSPPGRRRRRRPARRAPSWPAWR